MNEQRLKAIRILEIIAEEMGDEDMFDGEIWFHLEDHITEIISE